MTAYLAAIERYKRERPKYEQALSAVVVALTRVSFEKSIPSRVMGRVKDTASLLKKMIRKAKSYDDVTDKAGARMIVAYPDDLNRAVEAVRSALNEVKFEDKATELRFNEFSYSGVHCDVVEPATGLRCEVQIHSPGVALWAGLAHDIIYKAPDEPATQLKRGMHRLMALAELIDHEAARIRQELLSSETAGASSALLELERHFFPLAARNYDPQLSIQILTKVAALIDDASFARDLETFCSDAANQRKLSELFRAYADDDRNLLMGQPESLLVFMLLERDSNLLSEAWPAALRPLLLDLATVWGKPIEDDGP